MELSKDNATGESAAVPDAAWTFLSNHAHVLAYLAEHPGARLRDVAAEVGITERSAMRLITQLDEAGILRRTRQGRRNLYHIDVDASLKHPLEAHCTVGRLLEIVISPESLQRLRHEQQSDSISGTANSRTGKNKFQKTGGSAR